MKKSNTCTATLDITIFLWLPKWNILILGKKLTYLIETIIAPNHLSLINWTGLKITLKCVLKESISIKKICLLFWSALRNETFLAPFQILESNF